MVEAWLVFLLWEGRWFSIEVTHSRQPGPQRMLGKGLEPGACHEARAANPLLCCLFSEQQGESSEEPRWSFIHGKQWCQSCDLESEHPNFFYNFFNCCHTATHMQTYIQRNRQSARFTTEGISFLFVDTKRAPWGYTGQAGAYKHVTHCLPGTSAGTQGRCTVWPGSRRSCWTWSSLWRGGDKAAWETLTYCLSITENYTLWNSIRSF